MRLSNNWFPTSLVEQAAWFNNFMEQFQPLATSLGFSVAEVTAISEDNGDFQSIVATTFELDVFSAAVRQFRRSLCEGDVGDPQPTFPAATFTDTPNNRPAGIFERLDGYVKRIRASPVFTPEMGDLLGINPQSSEGIAPVDVKPTIKLTASVHNYLFSVVVSGRRDADQWQVWIKPGGLESFEMLGTATGKSADFTYSPGGEVPAPAALQVYVQLRRSNADYGQPSDIALVTVNP